MELSDARLGSNLSTGRAVAAFLGFGGIATFAVEIAKIVFFVAIVLFVISAVVTLIRGRSPTMP